MSRALSFNVVATLLPARTRLQEITMTHYVFTNDVADASVVSAQALNALNAGRLTAAVNLYLRAIELRPEKASFHNNCGVALMRLNRLDEAQRAFRRAIELDRNYGDPLVNLATALITLQEQRDAVDSPSCKSSGFTLELEEAERLLRLALQCDGDRLDALLALAYVLERKRCLRECFFEIFIYVLTIWALLTDPGRMSAVA